VLRIGKPFGETGGGESFTFPLPSTVAGALRTAHADALGMDFRSNSDIEQIVSWNCHGALPAEISKDGVAALFPRPTDTRYGSTSPVSLQTLAPLELGEGEGCDLPDGLLPVFLQDDDKSKPADGPNWWTQKAMLEWLTGSTPNLEELGPVPLPVDTRTHVALDPSTLAAYEGQLFQSAGPDFEAQQIKPHREIAGRGWLARRHALLVRFSEALAPSLLRLGGEGRLANVSPCDAWPEISDGLKSALEASQRIRLILATPALFDGGWKPGWINSDWKGSPPQCPGLVLRLRAAAVERWQPISGWDMKERKPKAIRRLAPAGSVYWFEIIEAPNDWIDALWLSPISDTEQDRRDGFGLSAPGVWN
jgi:CRISPR-associated protein Cmr3